MRAALTSVIDRSRGIRNDSPVPLVQRNTTPESLGAGLSGRPGSGNEIQLMDTMSYNGTVWSIVTRISTAEAAIKWRLYRKGKGGTSADIEDREEVTDHLALTVWNRPNPFHTENEFTRQFVLQRELAGRCYWVWEDHPAMPGVPLQLWNVRPDRVYPVVDPFRYITAWMYLGPDGDRTFLRPEQVIQQRYPHPYLPFESLGPVQSILVAVKGMAAALDYNERFFRNSAIPGGVIEIEDVMTDPDYITFTERLREGHRGIVNAFRPLVLEGNAKWKDATLSQRDMQFPELIDVDRELIMEAFGISRTILGQVEQGATRASAETAEVVFGKLGLEPRLDMTKGALNCHFLPLFGGSAVGLEFDYDSPVPADSEDELKDRDSRVSGAVAYRGMGYSPEASLTAWDLPIPDEDLTSDTDGVEPTPEDIALFMQKVYLAVGVVLTADEARELANKMGANLVGSLPEKAEPAPIDVGSTTIEEDANEIDDPDPDPDEELGEVEDKDQ